MLCAVFGLGQALPVLHFVLVAHQLCAEHGALVHADAGSSPAAHGPEGQPASSDAQLLDSGSEPHAHDHCGVAIAGQAHAVRLGSPEGCLYAASYRAGGTGAARAAHSSIALLSYAPKLAPPLA